MFEMESDGMLCFIENEIDSLERLHVRNDE